MSLICPLWAFNPTWVWCKLFFSVVCSIFHPSITDPVSAVFWCRWLAGRQAGLSTLCKMWTCGSQVVAPVSKDTIWLTAESIYLYSIGPHTTHACSAVAGHCPVLCPVVGYSTLLRCLIVRPLLHSVIHSVTHSLTHRILSVLLYFCMSLYRRACCVCVCVWEGVCNESESIGVVTCIRWSHRLTADRISCFIVDVL